METTASVGLADVEDRVATVATVATVAMADTDDVTWGMLRKAGHLENSLLLSVAGSVEVVVLLRNSVLDF